jgi:hypothetical protein
MMMVGIDTRAQNANAPGPSAGLIKIVPAQTASIKPMMIMFILQKV